MLVGKLPSSLRTLQTADAANRIRMYHRRYHGAYFYGDFQRNTLSYLTFNDDLAQVNASKEFDSSIKSPIHITRDLTVSTSVKPHLFVVSLSTCES